MDNKTAIQEYIERLRNLNKALATNTAHNRAVKAAYVHSIMIAQECLEKERQQIEEAYKQGDEDGFHSTESVSDYEIEGPSDYLASNYFNQTYQ